MTRSITIFLVAMLVSPLTAAAETPDEWVAHGARVHGAFGAFIPLGIAEMNKTLQPPGRYDAVMATDGLFSVEPAP
jgi:hypothetical protein